MHNNKEYEELLGNKYDRYGKDKAKKILVDFFGYTLKSENERQHNFDDLWFLTRSGEDMVCEASAKTSRETFQKMLSQSFKFQSIHVEERKVAQGIPAEAKHAWYIQVPYFPDEEYAPFAFVVNYNDIMNPEISKKILVNSFNSDTGRWINNEPMYDVDNKYVTLLIKTSDKPTYVTIKKFGTLKVEDYFHHIPQDTLNKFPELADFWVKWRIVISEQ